MKKRFSPDPFVLLLLAAIPVFFVYLGANSIWDANEAFYVETPKQMLLSGDYVNPSFNGAPRFNKPVLSYWIVAGLYHLLGVTLTAERIGIALGAVGIIAATFVIGRALRSVPVGALAALLLATAPRFVMLSRRIFIDIYLTLFMSLALACFMLAQRQPAYRRRYLLLMYACLGFGALTKGPVAIALPVLVYAAWIVVERRWNDLGRMMLGPGVLIILVIVVPWYAADYAQHGTTHITQFFVGENLSRYATTMAGERQPLFYLPVLLADLLFPWALLALIPLFTGWAPRATGESEPDVSLRRFLWLWIVVIVGVFSFSQTKEDLYILPVVPALAVLGADALTRLDFGRGSRTMRAILAIAGSICLICGVAVYRVFGAPYLNLAGAAAGAVVLAAGGAAAVAGVAMRRPRAAVLSLAAAFAIFNYLFVIQILPSSERYKPVLGLARTFKERAASSATLASYHLMLPSLVYYAERPVEDIDADDRAKAFFGKSNAAWAITSEEDYERLRRIVPALCVVDRRPRLDLNLRNIIQNTPLPMALLVTNACGK